MSRLPAEAGEKQFTSAFENAAIGMSVLAPDSRRLRVNHALCAMLGYSEAELLSRTVLQITHPDDLPEDLRERQLCLAGAKHTYQREKRYLHRDGHVLWGHLTCTLVRDGAGQPLHFISQVVDITERKLAQQRLQEMQALLAMAAQIGRLGAWAWERGQSVVKWSEEVCAIHDVKAGFAPTLEEGIAFFAPHDRDRMRSTLLACAQDGSPFDAEAQIVTAKGRELWVRIIAEAQWDANGKVRRIQGACQDITDARRAAEQARQVARQHTLTLENLNSELERRVHQRTAQLEAANGELEAFSYSIAHDLRAPLSSIDGFSKMLEQACCRESTGRTAHYLSRIRAGVRQMGELTEGLLALASLSRAEMLDDDVDLAELARDAVLACRERSPRRRVDVSIAPSMPARGDARLLAQVMGNLVGNAWKFTGQREHAAIDIGSRRQAGTTVYFVRDNGAGFDMAYASRMFEAFQRLHAASEFEGTGIGLAIVHKIVTRHGGRIWAQAAPQQGATFHFTLAPAP